MISTKTGLFLVKTYIITLMFIWILPNYESIDKIGSQWFHLGLVNFIGLILLLITRAIDKSKQINLNIPLLFLSGLFVWGLGSIFYAENTSEVLIESARLFTLLTLLFILFSLVKRFSISFQFLVSLFVASLFIETLMVLVYTIIEQGTLIGLNRDQINLGISGNINITAYSILYKIPFAVYLYATSKNKTVRLSLPILLLFSFIIIFLLATRSAIISSFIIVIFSIVFSFYLEKKGKRKIRNSLVLLLPILLAFFFSEFSSQISNTSSSVTDRLQTIQLSSIEDTSINERLTYYNFSLNYFISNPLLGMGFGNWKINSIPYTMDKKSTYVVAYHNHNDFLQVLAELGFLGLLLYSCFFISTLYILFKAYKRGKITANHYLCLLLYAIIYFIDANFNFPYARVIIQTNLLIVIAYILSLGSSANSKIILKYPSVFLVLLMGMTSIAIYSHYRVLTSFIEQKKIYLDFNSQTRTIPTEQALNFESSYPNISNTCLPLKALKASYLVNGNEEELISAIGMAKRSIKDNPYISYGQALLAQLYSSLGKLDSSKYFAKQAYYNMPSIELHVATYLPFIKYEQDINELDNMKNALLKSNSRYVWKSYIETLMNLKDSLDNTDKELLQVASDKFIDYNYLKNLNQLKDYKSKVLLEAEDIAQKAEILFKEGNYEQAANLYAEANSIIPEEPAYVENQARAYMLNKNYSKSIEVFEKLITNYSDKTGQPEFYIGAMLIVIEEKEKACEKLSTSIKKGYYPAKTLYTKTCLN